MTIEATATALVQDDAAPVETPQDSQEVDLTSELNDIWERNNAEPDEKPDEAEPETPETTQEAEATEEAGEAADDGNEEEAVEAPSELPVAIKKNWSSIPEEAQNAFLEAQREANRKLSEQGRLMQGISPIRDVLTEAVKELPALADMRPQDVAQEVMALAKISNDFNEKPVETMMGLIKQHGLEQAIAQNLSGTPATPDAAQNATLQNEIKTLKRQLAQVSDPEYLSSQFDAFSTRSRTQQTVDQFAASKPDWAEVEPLLPAAIQFVQQSAEGISEQDTLERAYTLALSQIKPDAIKATPEAAAPKAAAPVDPERSRKAQKAKSINVTDRGTGKSKPLTEDQILNQIWAKNQS